MKNRERLIEELETLLILAKANPSDFNAGIEISRRLQVLSNWWKGMCEFQMSGSSGAPLSVTGF